jgi:uncharacterized protein YndB with AHSA1/START domain
MAMINSSVRAHSSIDKAHAALTTPDGYRKWWSKNCAIAEQVGRESMLHFDKGGTPVTMRFRVDAIERDRIKWTCIGHDMPTWIGTTLEWKLEPADGDVEISLVHDGWKDAAPDMVAQGWKHFLGSLKQYLETGAGEPW